jgi:hypothetical protein
MRVILDDALAFARREGRRGARYHAVLLDPPHYGRGPKGEKWQFEDSIGALVAAARELVADRALVVLSSYAIGCSPLTLQNLLAIRRGRSRVRRGSPRPERFGAASCRPVSGVIARRQPTAAAGDAGDAPDRPPPRQPRPGVAAGGSRFGARRERRRVARPRQLAGRAEFKPGTSSWCRAAP